MKRIKPCPYCGADPIITLIGGYFKVRCINPECPGRQKWVDKKLAIEAWNTRAKRRPKNAGPDVNL